MSIKQHRPSLRDVAVTAALETAIVGQSKRGTA
jgi:hypothetical protein